MHLVAELRNHKKIDLDKDIMKDIQDDLNLMDRKY